MGVGSREEGMGDASLSPAAVSLIEEFARAAVTKHHRLRGLNNRNVLSPSSGG